MRDNLVIARHPSIAYRYGLLGAQAAASGIGQFTQRPCKVVAFNPVETDVGRLVERLAEAYSPVKTNIGVSGLCYYDTQFFELVERLKERKFTLYLGGPESLVNFQGEPPNPRVKRFEGLKNLFQFAVGGDVSNLYGWLQGGNLTGTSAWDYHAILSVDWGNLLRADVGRELEPFPELDYAQVVGQIGCPYASRRRLRTIPLPKWMYPGSIQSVGLSGCSFCSIAKDKKCQKHLPVEDIVTQIMRLPEKDGKKVYFEYIDEAPFTWLPKVFDALKKQGVSLEGVRVTTRADWFLRQQAHVIQTIEAAKRNGTYIVMFCMGLESFDETSLIGLNKGTTVEQNLRAVDTMRNLKRAYPDNWKYSRAEIHTNHGLITPTIWDTPDSLRAQLALIEQNGLLEDIYLRRFDNVLEIPHASGLGDLVRMIEDTTDGFFTRSGMLIEWANKCPYFTEMTSILREFNEMHGLGDNNTGNTQNKPGYDADGNLQAVEPK